MRSGEKMEELKNNFGKKLEIFCKIRLCFRPVQFGLLHAGDDGYDSESGD